MLGVPINYVQFADHYNHCYNFCRPTDQILRHNEEKRALATQGIGSIVDKKI